jgi:hypothetical protein
MSILGNRVLRTEDPKFLTSGGTYVADVELPDGRRPRGVRPLDDRPRHLEAIDVDEARVDAGRDRRGHRRRPRRGADATVPSDVQPGHGPAAARHRTGCATSASRSPRDRRDRRPGPRRGRDWCSSTTSRSTRSSTPRAALDSDVSSSPRPARTCRSTIDARKLTADLDDCEVVVSQRIINQRVAPGAHRARVAAAYWTDDGRLVHYASSQGAHPVRDTICSASSGSRPSRSGSSPPTWAAASAPRAAPTSRRCSSAGSPPGRATGAVGRDPLREPGRHGPRTRPGPVRRDRRAPRRHHHRLPPRHRPGRRGLPEHRRQCCRG